MSVFDDGPVLLSSPAVMLAVFEELVGPDGLTWRGGIDAWNTSGEPGDVTWRLMLNDDKGNSVSAVQGQYLAMAYNRLLVLDDADL